MILKWLHIPSLTESFETKVDLETFSDLLEELKNSYEIL